MGGRAPEAAAPLGVVVAHPHLVVDAPLFLARVQDEPAARARVAGGPALPDHAQEVLVQVAPEGAPDGVVIPHALGALGW